MATFNKRGYKAPKEKVNETEKLLEENIADAQNDAALHDDSTTAKAFDALDETANKTEEWVVRNQKMIMGVIAGIALLTVGYLAYQKFVVAPKETEATEDLFVAQKNFQLAIDEQDAKKQDSLFKLVLKGSEGKLGIAEFAEENSGTAAGNLANYYAGITYLNTKQYDKAIESLEKFSSKDQFLGAIAIGAIGDAYSQKNDAKKALEYYEKAARTNENDMTTPRFLMKAAQVAYSLNNKADALKYFNEIKEKYETSPEAQNIDALIGMAQ
jgi:tetratricopeptide (TPR) repeat protein